ncbi:undecaprenyl-diphosphatase [Terribacillus aidingensis]|uniref:Undecaprenyl-diphosphatase n=1 Tax=Terribacillus aidingensis TaxID=586416 RepID=A0A285NXZ4_9BACI|nr:phosphatase PAP2 family protein [Terribacillus aidingensis]SNZ14364.1 undecaprenyl-diphosphatase [Terribacillus aidingensis]
MELPHRKRYILLFTISIILAFLLMMDVRLHAEPLLDQWTSAYPASLEGTFWYDLFRWITELGSSTVLSVLAFVFGLFLAVKRKDLIGAGIVFTATALGYQFNFLIKGVVQRERPLILAIVDGEGFSFPSGHSMVSFITYGIIVYFLWKHLKKKLRLTIAVLAGFLVLLIGISRYVLRVHYLTDILGGYSFGLIFLIIWILLYKWLRHKYGREKVRSY